MTARGWFTGVALAAVLVLSLPQSGFADTVTGSVKADGLRVYVFTADDSGQALLTLTWAKANADLFLLVIDDGDDPLTWCIAATSQSRTQRCDFGAIRSVTYVVGVSSLRGRSKFQLNVQSSGSEFVFGPDHVEGLRELGPDDPRHARVAERMSRLRPMGGAGR